jgi:hypothetical protein
MTYRTNLSIEAMAPFPTLSYNKYYSLFIWTLIKKTTFLSHPNENHGLHQNYNFPFCLDVCGFIQEWLENVGDVYFYFKELVH